MSRNLLALVGWTAAAGTAAACLIGLVFVFQAIAPSLEDEYLRLRYGYGEADVEQYHRRHERLRK
jgi:hypothetical protein